MQESVAVQRLETALCSGKNTCMHALQWMCVGPGYARVVVTSIRPKFVVLCMHSFLRSVEKNAICHSGHGM